MPVVPDDAYGPRRQPPSASGGGNPQLSEQGRAQESHVLGKVIGTHSHATCA